MSFILLLLFIVVASSGLIFLVHGEQKVMDHQRKHYRVYFPSALDADMVTAWVRSISGTLKRHNPVTGAPTIAFELWSSASGIEHRLKVPWAQAEYVVGQLRSLVPGIRVEPELDVPYRRWTHAVEIGLTKGSRTLRIYNTASTATSILASVQSLEPGETLMMQWVISPAPPEPLPVYREAQSDELGPRNLWHGNEANRDEVKDRREKLSEPNMLAVLRVAAVAKSEVRAEHLVYRVRAALASTRSPHTRFQKRFATANMLQKRIDWIKTPVNFGMMLSSTELAAMVAWPIDSPFINGLPQPHARQLPAPESVPRKGRIIGVSNFPGNERPIAIGFEDVRKHIHVVGPSGVGKSTLLANMMKQDMEAGYGVILIENKGDLFESGLSYVPKTRLGDVIVLDVNDKRRPVGFNILQQGDPMIVVDELVALFERLYQGASSVWTREVLYHALRTLATDPRLTFVDLAALLVPMTSDEIKWGDKLKRSLKDKELRNFWQRFDNQPRAAQDRITQPVMDRIWQLNARPEVRNIIGQSDSSFQMADVFRENKILLVNLTGLPRQTASLLGTLLMNAVWDGVKAVKPKKPTYLYLDEFQDFVDLPIDPEELLTKARSFGLGMTLAHQHLAQLPNELKSAVMANARSKIVFQASSDDAMKMAKEFGNTLTEDDFKNLGRYEAIARIATDDGVSSPMTFRASAPAPAHGLQRTVVTMSRRDYGVPEAVVERQINERRKESKAPEGSKRPAIGMSEEFGEASA